MAAVTACQFFAIVLASCDSLVRHSLPVIHTDYFLASLGDRLEPTVAHKSTQPPLKPHKKNWPPTNCFKITLQPIFQTLFVHRNMPSA